MFKSIDTIAVKYDVFLIFIILTLVSFSLAFFPLLAFILIIVVLSVFTVRIPEFFRKFLHILALFSLVVVYSSKSFYNELSMDLSSYIMVNDELRRLSFYQIFSTHFSLEPGWNIIYWIIYNAGLNITDEGVGVANYFICCILFYFWFEVHGIKEFQQEFRSIATATSLLFLSVLFLAIMQRQAIASIFILFAISNIKNLKKLLLYSFVAILFHSTSIIFIILYYFLMKLKLKYYHWFLIAFFILLFKIFFIYFINLLVDLEAFSNKAEYYKNTFDFDFFSIKLLCYVLFVVFSLIFYRGSALSHSRYANIMVFSLICYILMIGINLLPERLNFINIYLMGFYISLIYLPKHYRLLLILNLTFCLIFYFEKTLSNTGFDKYWYRYEEYSLIPFYYIERLF